MYRRFIKRGNSLVGPYWYKSVRVGDRVVGKYVGPASSEWNSAGVSIGRTLTNYRPPQRYSNARKIYESSTGRKFPLKKVIVDKDNKFLEPKYNASVDTRIGVAIIAPRMPKPEKTKALLEEALHMDGHGEKTAEPTALKMMKKTWKGLPPTEINKLRGRDPKTGRPIRHSRKPVLPVPTEATRVEPHPGYLQPIAYKDGSGFGFPKKGDKDGNIRMKGEGFVLYSSKKRRVS